MSIVHGSLSIAELRKLGVPAETVLDFSSNINPLGASESVKRAAVTADLAAYPDRDCLLLREALAARLQLDVEQLLIGNGSTELIHLLARARLRSSSRCLIFEPTFGEYEAAVALAGGRIHRLRAAEADSFRWSIDVALKTISEIQPDLVFICNPNNPTGVYLSREDVQRILAAVGQYGLLLVDDAYASLMQRRWDPVSLLPNNNLAVLRSMTKDHALAGVRLVYLLAAPSLLEAMTSLQHTWSVNAVAQAAGLAALNDEEHVAVARDVIAVAKDYLYEQFRSMGLAFEPSAANFLIVEVGDARRVRTELLHRGIAVRDCTSFGLPQYIRIAVRRQEECELLISALQKVMGCSAPSRTAPAPAYGESPAEAV